jgi:thymidylate kinase
VAIEGIDGSGKTTQAMMLVNRLNKNEYRADYVRPIYVLADWIPFLNSNEDKISPRKARTSHKSCEGVTSGKHILICIFVYAYSLMSYLALIYLGRNGRIIVCDRFFYQFFFDTFGKSADKLLRIFPKADITFILKDNINNLINRMIDPFDISVDKSYYILTLDRYSKLSKRCGFTEIDASLNPKKINDKMFFPILNHIGCRNEK